MNNRRSFLAKATLASTALVLLKPLQSLASQLKGSGLSYGSNRLVLLHTPYLNNSRGHLLQQQLHYCKNKKAQALLLQSSSVQNDAGTLAFDATVSQLNNEVGEKDYTVIRKGNIRTGIVRITEAGGSAMQKIDEVAAYLKQHKNCDVVICLSTLGYACSTANDDVTLARASTHIDVIIGGHPTNFHAQPVIILNKQQAEVIIHAAGDNSFGYGQVVIDFDEDGKKRQVSFAA